jgi:hypothetical protein
MRASIQMPMRQLLQHWSVLPGALHASPLAPLPQRPRSITRRLRRTRRGRGCGVPEALAPREAAHRPLPGGAALPLTMLVPPLLLEAGCAPPTMSGRATMALCRTTRNCRSCTCRQAASAHRSEPRERLLLRPRRRRGSLAGRQPRFLLLLLFLGRRITCGSATTAPWRRIPSVARWFARLGLVARLHREEGHGAKGRSVGAVHVVEGTSDVYYMLI